jgi:hypothetical protein
MFLGARRSAGARTARGKRAGSWQTGVLGAHALDHLGRRGTERSQTTPWRAIQLGIEYDPEPPFDSGSPERASPDLVRLVRERLAPSWREYAAQLPER